MNPIFDTYDKEKLLKAKAYLQGAIRRCDLQNEEIAKAEVFAQNQIEKGFLLMNLETIDSILNEKANATA